MSSLTLEIREDVSHPEGGHAIIVIKGLTSIPDNGAFAIEPADGALAARDLKGWPVGARRPLKTTMSTTGFEIAIGPDVVECPVLLPGTPVVIKVPAAGVSLQALWPDITPLRRPKVKRIITSTERRDALARAQSNVTSIDVAARSTAGEKGQSPVAANPAQNPAGPAAVQPAINAPRSATPQSASNVAQLAPQSPPASAVEKLISGQIGQAPAQAPGQIPAQTSPQTVPQASVETSPQASAPAKEPVDASIVDGASIASAAPAHKKSDAPAAEQSPAATAQPAKAIGNLSKLSLATAAGKSATELPSGNDNHLPQTPRKHPPGNRTNTTGTSSVSSRGMEPRAVAQLAVKSSITQPARREAAAKPRAAAPGNASPKQQEDMLVAALSSQSVDPAAPAGAEPPPAAQMPVAAKKAALSDVPSASNGPGLPKQPMNQSTIVSKKKKPPLLRKSIAQVAVAALSPAAAPGTAAAPPDAAAAHAKHVPPALPAAAATQGPAKAPAHSTALIQAQDERRTRVALHKDAEQPVPQVRELRAERPSRRWRKDGWLSGVASGALATIVALFGYVSLIGWPDLSTFGLPSVTPAGSVSQHGEGLAIYDALRVGTVSPRGILASNVDGDAAILRADGAVRVASNGRARDTDEGAFWFKQYLARQIGDKRTIWAITQLGTTYANPMEGTPDYKKAQVLWEAAAALGDPYAACFLGQLYEHGLGVATSRTMALTWYLRARSAGGCQSLNTSIARLGG